MKKFLVLCLVAVCSCISASAVEQFVGFKGGDMAIVQKGKPLNILVDQNDYDGVLMAVASLQNDFMTVCGAKPEVIASAEDECIIVGSLNSALIQEVLKSGKIREDELKGKTEKYILQVVDKPVSGVKRALVIAGSDKRGTIYGIYELSKQIGVSPWYWWMDVPVDKHENIYVKKGAFTDGEPKVAYRGIFINDEHPSFARWSDQQFGGQNSRCYEKIFELLLRLKANYMWPAMWNNAFYDDDPENGPLADKMGIVMGTSHHEPLALAQQDWKRRPGHGAWSFVRNKEEMLDFWRGGVERSKNWETIYTIGMRGDGDEPMEDEASVKTMESIVAAQRQLISEVTGKNAEDVPQVWALYKEVQDYYDQGMQVPDDVILLLCDDNWGNIRRVPSEQARKRKGGFGMYYHVDYVGAPRNSKWINISPIPRIWEQMNLSYRNGIDKMWILNVGDLKPMEYPIQFFLDMAWDPDRYNPDNLIRHSVDFCESVFGEEYAEEAARLLRTYPKYNRRMTPESLTSKTYSVANYNEWERVTAAYDQLALDAHALRDRLPSETHDAWFQLIGYPVMACANLYDMYYAQAMNHRLANDNDPAANLWADRVAECFAKDAALCKEYHNLNGGKWNHMMDEIYIGYTSWNSPKEKSMPAVIRVEGTPSGMISLPVPAREVYSDPGTAPVFMEKDGYITIEAEHFTRKTDGNDAAWTVIPEMGRTLSAITTLPVTECVEDMSLEYDFELEHGGCARITLRFCPTLNINTTGLRYAVSVDGGKEEIVNLNGSYAGELGQWQKEHVIDSQTSFNLKAGRHTLRYHPLDNALVLQKILIDMGGHRNSFLWAPETPAQNWVGTWATAQERAKGSDMPQILGLSGNSLRQTVRVSLGGEEMRLQLSNIFGAEPVEIKSIYVADALEGHEIDSKTAKYLKFGGKESVILEPGKSVMSDVLKYELKPLQNLSITINYVSAPSDVMTSHRGSRTTSYIMVGESKPKTEFKVGEALQHWYSIAAIDVIAPEGTKCIAVIGDSITDGRGSTTDRQNRWPDMLSSALEGKVGVLNLGIGGNCVLEGGLSDPAVERFDRDVLCQRGVTTVVVFEGINDIGGSKNSELTALRLKEAYREFIGKAHENGMKIYGCTITQMYGSSYWSPYHEAARQDINEWIRTSGAFDGVVDFDRLTQNPDRPEELLPAYKSDDLHPNAAGYAVMGAAAAEILDN